MTRGLPRVPRRPALALGAGVLTAAVLGAPTASAQSDEPIYVRPGAPGEPTQRISPADVAVLERAPFSADDAHFMQHMIVHHGQALEMNALVPGRVQDGRVATFARQIDIAQSGEITQMTQWLELRGQEVPDEAYAEAHKGMAGMVSDEDMAELATLTGAAFDVRYLELMIQHHVGALVMVDKLLVDTGGFPEPAVRILADEIVDHQNTEINRMRMVLDDLRGGA